MGALSNLCLMFGVPITALGILGLGTEPRILFAGLTFLLMALGNEIIDRKERENIGNAKGRSC